MVEDGSNVPSWLRELGAVVKVMDVPTPLVPPSNNGGRRAAVLLLFADGLGGPDLLVIRRGTDLRLHAGEAAFPGGEIDSTDDGPVDAALREMTEEVGIAPDDVEVVAVLPEMFIPPTRFRVFPVLAWWRRPRAVAPVDPLEVATVERIRIREFADPAVRVMLHRPNGIILPAFRVRDGLVWGLTATLIDRIIHFGGWERPWDSRVQELPPHMDK